MERVWFGRGPAPVVARVLLAPISLAYAAVVRARNAAYAAGLFRSRPTAVPAVSVGNLTVGGTGKTPVAAWVAAQLRERGARPAIVLRGYGGDESLVHEVLNPGLPVIVGADRVSAVAAAAAGGADVVVLDDAFQHRRARRAEDVVLVSADAWGRGDRLLPAGPWREPASGLRRASLVIVTRKAVSRERGGVVVEAVRRIAPAVPVAQVQLAADTIRGDGQEHPLAWVQGRRVRAIAAIGDPGAFVSQLEQAGASVTPALWPDHHHFSRREAEALAASLRPEELAICTLKDAVKLRAHWPRAAPALWYLSQRVLLERGEDDVMRVLERLLRGARAP